MISPKVYKMLGIPAGDKLPSFTQPGGYPIVYYCLDGDILCPDCVNGENGSLAPYVYADDPEWTVIAAEEFLEGPTERCAHCGAEIESAYGFPSCDDESDQKEVRNEGGV